MGKKETYKNGSNLKRKKRKSKKRGPIIVLSLILVIIAVICAIYFTNDKKEANSDKTTQNTTSSHTSKNTTVTESTTAKAKTVSEQLNSKEWYLAYVNIDNKMPDNYVPKTSKLIDGNSQQMDSRVAPYYIEMYNAAKKDGCTLTPYSGYRSYADQDRFYKSVIASYKKSGYSDEKAIAIAQTVILPPGTSEHNLGFSMDIVCADDSFSNTAELKWLNEHAADYGFILRYPKDKTEITKIKYEPWHWRYVGEKTAKEMKKSGQCLEEYLGLIK